MEIFYTLIIIFSLRMQLKKTGSSHKRKSCSFHDITQDDDTGRTSLKGVIIRLILAVSKPIKHIKIVRKV